MKFRNKAFKILTIISLVTLSINNRPVYGNLILNRQVNNLIRQAEDNLDKNNYSKAIKFYTDAIERDSSRANLYLKRAQAYQAFGNNKKALNDYKKAIQIDSSYSNSYDFFFNRSLSHADLGDYESAIKDLNKAIVIKPRSLYAHYNRGLYKQRLGDYESAIDDYTKSIDIFPTSDSLYWRARLKEELGDYEEALVDYNEAIKINPSDSDNFNSRGVLYRRKLKNYPLAFEDFKKAHELDPERTTILNNLCDLENDRENYKSAILFCNKSIGINGGDYSNLFLRSQVYFGLKKYKLALKDINSAIELNNKNENDFAFRAFLKGILNDTNGAIEDFNIYLSKNPDDTFILRQRAYAYYTQENYDLAKIEYIKLIEKDGNNPDDFYYLSEINYDLEDYEKSLLYINKAIELESNDNSYFSTRAKINYELKDNEKVIMDLNKAIEIDSSNAYSYYLRGFMYSRFKKNEKALKDLNKSIDLDPTYSKAYSERASIKEKEYPIEAMDDYTKVIELDSRNALAFNNRGVIKYDLGNYQEALEDYQKALNINPNEKLYLSNIGEVQIKLGDIDSACTNLKKASELGDVFAKNLSEEECL